MTISLPHQAGDTTLSLAYSAHQLIDNSKTNIELDNNLPAITVLQDLQKQEQQQKNPRRQYTHTNANSTFNTSR